MTRDVLGWTPQDSADPFAGQLAGKVSGDPIEERYMGGNFCSMDYSRDAPAPAGLFGKDSGRDRRLRQSSRRTGWDPRRIPNGAGLHHEIQKPVRADGRNELDEPPSAASVDVMNRRTATARLGKIVAA